MTPSAGPGGTAQTPSRIPPWEDFYRAASPAQQAELLALAGRQGVLYAHQLPPAANGTGSHPGRALLSALLNGQTAELPAVRREPVAFRDTELDEGQREAVARALATPDICLVQGLPGTGKARVLAEIIAQANQRGQRILLVAPTPAAIDRVLELVAGFETTFALRCLGRDEDPASLSGAVRGLSFAARVRHFQETAARHARDGLAATEQACRRKREDAGCWDRLAELAQRGEALADQIRAFRDARELVPTDVEREAAAAESPDAAGNDDDFAETVRANVRERDAVARCTDEALTAARSQVEAMRRQFEELTAKADALRPLVEAKQHHAWWSGAWWRATVQGNVLARHEELQEKRRRAEDELRAHEEREQQLSRQREQALDQFRARLEAAVKAEVSRRLADLDDTLAALGQEAATIQEKWRNTCDEFDPETAPPAALTRQAVEGGRAAWHGQLARLEEHGTIARQWADYLRAGGDDFAGRLRGYANLVAATLSSLGDDAHFGDAARPELGFDVLLVADADQVTETEFLKVAARAGRWVLLGEPTAEAEQPAARPDPPKPARQRGRGPAHTSARAQAALRPGFFQRLWQHLDCDPRRLPYRWGREHDRICCRLRPVTPEQRPFLESERVADSPDIELRILALPRAKPALAEVVFPATVSIAEAKEYIFRELEELPVASAGHGLRWDEDAHTVVFQLGPVPAGEEVAARLEPGVSEWVACDGAAPVLGVTSRLVFDRAAGWDGRRAAEWVERRLGLRDLGRCARLDFPHRMRPALARFLADLLFNEDGYLPAWISSEPDDPAVEFVPVPSLGSESEPRRPRDLHARLRAVKGGAGLEAELADLHGRAAVPEPVRSALPGQGLVNYLEAVAVVRRLEALAREAAAVQGGVNAALNGAAAATAAPAAAAVIALYPAQAALIRRLAEQSPALAPLDLTIDVPAALSHQEFPVVLVSLTRSHNHRAVTYGGGLRTLALAVTRARQRLILVGDPGTLIRRSQWQGPLDELDAAAAGRERDIITRLVHYLHGHGPHARVFHLSEGSGA